MKTKTVVKQGQSPKIEVALQLLHLARIIRRREENPEAVRAAADFEEMIQGVIDAAQPAMKKAA